MRFRSVVSRNRGRKIRHNAGVTVNNVLPGYTRTERLQQLAETMAMDRDVTPDEVPVFGEAPGLRGLVIATGFSGHGFGHGVGLCQYGAQSLARDGKAYAAIVEWYYPGAAIVRAYG